MKKGLRSKGGSKTMVMMALGAVLLVSLGYLLSQGGGREGFSDSSGNTVTDTSGNALPHSTAPHVGLPPPS